MQLLTSCWLMPGQSPSSDPPLPAKLPQFYCSALSYGVEYCFGQFGAAVLAVAPPSFLGTPRFRWQSSLRI